MSIEKGSLSINSENILPIIKKWLYSDTDIFIRELVSNSCDAITKLKKLVDIGEVTVSNDEKYRIDIILDKENKTIKIIDNGLGMTADEIKEYINQIAFSGASAFIEKYNEQLNDDNDIIGHFGLGFYSAFMVSNIVTIDTLSYLENAEAVKWSCDGGIEYNLEKSDRNIRGTEITLFISDDNIEFLDQFKLKSIINKYCGFMPVEIFFTSLEDLKKDKENADETDTEIKEEMPINDPNPLWLKNPNDCTPEEYKAFYSKMFMDFNEPLFWMHLNMDYPFRLKGILYFPKLKHELESIEGQVKLYNNQVFIADNIKEVIPEFLLLLKGVIDCPDLPLNVSRSFLQNDKNVNKMSTYITRKVSDKLTSLYKNEKDHYVSYWNDISPFIKYGCIKDKAFYDKIRNSILYETINGEFLTIDEYIEKNQEKSKNIIYYVADKKQQAQYIKMFKDNGLDAVILNTHLDNPFISYVEGYESDKKITFSRIDADISETLKSSDLDNNMNEEDKKSLEEIFKKALGNENLIVSVENLKSESIPAVILLSEQSRRMEEMNKMFGGGGFPGMFSSKEETFVINANNKLIQKILKSKDDVSDATNLMCQQIYDLAMISHKPLEIDEMTKFIERSNLLLEKLSN